MKVRYGKRGGKYEWKDDNTLILGDFHRSGPDRATPIVDFVGDDTTDAFVLNDWGTGMAAVNYIVFSEFGKLRDEMAITWKQEGYLMSRE